MQKLKAQTPKNSSSMLDLYKKDVSNLINKKPRGVNFEKRHPFYNT